MKTDYFARMSTRAYLFYILRHPADGFREMKHNGKFSMRIANFLIAAWVLLAILNWGYIDYDFRSRFGEVEIVSVLMTTLLIFVLSVVSNWCFCTLMDGKGRLREIWVCLAYALLPYLIAGYFRFLMSFLLVYDEAVFLSYAVAAGGLWSFYMAMAALGSLHDYSVPKTAASAALTVFGILVIVFFMVLLSGLIVQIYQFFLTVVSEISYRMR